MSDSTSCKRVVSVGSMGLEGFLRLPPDPLGLVIFAHGAGSSHLSLRNNFVAEEFEKRAITTLLFDLLTEEETQNHANVFDIKLLSMRMVDAIFWSRANSDIPALPVGLFGSSTGAAAALVAAARTPSDVITVVSRGGRPDLADDALPQVHAPVLLIAGRKDYPVVWLNEAAAERLTCTWKLEVVDGATHLFKETGALEQEVVSLAGAWFETHSTKAETRL